jgi:hypothetical protein
MIYLRSTLVLSILVCLETPRQSFRPANGLGVSCGRFTCEEGRVGCAASSTDAVRIAAHVTPWRWCSVAGLQPASAPAEPGRIGFSF